MKQTKKFFDSNRLNKGYNAEAINDRANDNSFLRKKYEHILPPLDVVSEYEEVAPGTLSKLISMAESEQSHRHKMEIKAADDAIILEKVSRLSAILVMIVLSIASLLMVVATSFLSGMIFFGTSLLFIASVNFVHHRKSALRFKSNSNNHKPR